MPVIMAWSLRSCFFPPSLSPSPSQPQKECFQHFYSHLDRLFFLVAERVRQRSCQRALPRCHSSWQCDRGYPGHDSRTGGLDCRRLPMPGPEQHGQPERVCSSTILFSKSYGQLRPQTKIETGRGRRKRKWKMVLLLPVVNFDLSLITLDVQ